MPKTGSAVMCRSLPQMPHRQIFSSTSSRAGFGASRVSMAKGSPIARKTAALILASLSRRLDQFAPHRKPRRLAEAADQAPDALTRIKRDQHREHAESNHVDRAILREETVGEKIDQGADDRSLQRADAAHHDDEH